MLSYRPHCSALRHAGVVVLALFTGFFVVACGGGSGTSSTPQSLTIGGSVSGLAGSGLVLQNNAGYNLSVSGNGAFTFATPLASGATYVVTVQTQPTMPAQTCTVTSGLGTLGSTNITNVAVTCTTNSYTVAGSVSGLAGTGLVLQNNTGDSLAVSANGGFVFATPVASGATYGVTVLTQPTSPAQICTVASGSGTVGAANISNVAIACSTIVYTVGGTVSGLLGSGLVLQNNAGNNLPVPSNGRFSFSVPVASGGTYAVTVLTQPTTPTQTCTVTNGSGPVDSEASARVAIVCSTNSYTVGGTVSGLSGSSGLVLQNNTGDSVLVSSDGSFSFPTSIASGVTYAVTVKTQPTNPVQHCTLTNASGTVVAANVTNVAVTCLKVGKFVFVANEWGPGNGSVSTFAIAPVTGALTAVNGSPAAADTQPTSIAVDPTGGFAYVTNLNSADITTFTVDPNTGNLTNAVNVPSSTGSYEPMSIAIDPAGHYAFVGGNTIGPNPGSIDSYAISAAALTRGALTSVSGSPIPSGNFPQGLAVDPSSQFLFASNRYDNFITVYGIAAGGTLSQVTGSPFPSGHGPTGVAMYPAGGFVYVTNTGDGTVSAFSYGASNGVLSELSSLGSPYSVGSGGTTSAPVALAIDPTGKFLYVTNSGDGTVSAFTLDPLTGALSSVGAPITTGSGASSAPNGVKVDPSGQFVYVANTFDNTVSAFSVNGSTGALTLIGTVPTGAAPAGIAIE